MKEGSINQGSVFSAHLHLKHVMKATDQEYWKKKLEKLKTANRELHDKYSALKNMSRDLERSLKLQTSLFDAIPEDVVLVQDEKIVAINRTALKDLGYQREECVGRSALEFVHTDVLASVKGLHKKRLAGKSVPSQYEISLVSRSGERFECDLRVKKVRYKGRRAFLVLLSQQESRKKKEKEMIQNQKMEALMTMARGLNRQITRRLQTISENVQLMKEHCDPKSADFPERLRGIEEAKDWISKTSEALEVLSRLEQDPSDRRMFKVDDVIREVLDRIEPTFEEEGGKRGVVFTLRTYLRAHASLCGNPGEIRDVIVNMILNAMDAMPKGGDIYLSTEENGGHACIYVQDSGVGIAERINGRILDPFFTTKGDQGIGLGLSLSYAIIKRHGGDIEVTSRKGQGTIVTVRLPVPEPDIEEKGATLRRVRDAQILIIHSQDMVRELVAQTLGSKGYRTVKAASGQEGLNHLSRKGFDLLITDDVLSDMRADVLVKRARTMTRTLPMILITTLDRNPYGARFNGRDVDLIVRKPLNMKQFVRQVSELLFRKKRGTSTLQSHAVWQG